MQGTSLRRTPPSGWGAPLGGRHNGGAPQQCVTGAHLPRETLLLSAFGVNSHKGVRACGLSARLVVVAAERFGGVTSLGGRQIPLLNRRPTPLDAAFPTTPEPWMGVFKGGQRPARSDSSRIGALPLKKEFAAPGLPRRLSGGQGASLCHPRRRPDLQETRQNTCSCDERANVPRWRSRDRIARPDAR